MFNKINVLGIPIYRFNYDKDNIYPIEYRLDNIVEYDHKCQELIKSIYDNDLKNKLKNTF